MLEGSREAWAIDVLVAQAIGGPYSVQTWWTPCLEERIAATDAILEDSEDLEVLAEVKVPDYGGGLDMIGRLRRVSVTRRRGCEPQIRTLSVHECLLDTEEWSATRAGLR